MAAVKVTVTQAMIQVTDDCAKPTGTPRQLGCHCQLDQAVNAHTGRALAPGPIGGV